MEQLKLPVATTETIPGRSVTSHIGPVFGVIARAMGFTRGMKGFFRSFRHGEVSEYSETLEYARRNAIERMVEHAVDLGADAVVAMRFDSGDLGGAESTAELVAYGTAVKLD